MKKKWTKYYVQHLLKYECVVTNGFIESLKIDGKVKGMRDINKAQHAPYWIMYETGGTAVNRFSGVEVKLDPLELSIHNFCFNWLYRYERGIADLPVQVFDSMKYLLLAINPHAYMELLD